MVAVAGTLIGASVVFTGATLTWLVFALALGCVGVAFGGMTVNEIDSWRAVHQLEELHAPRLHEPAGQRDRELGARVA